MGTLRLARFSDELKDRLVVCDQAQIGRKECTRRGFNGYGFLHDVSVRRYREHSLKIERYRLLTIQTDSSTAPILLEVICDSIRSLGVASIASVMSLVEHAVREYDLDSDN